ncbi:transposase [Paenibacillus ginsengarvi]|uniref:Transposase n=1 Tax=Paenibacillus ginsengarvi TaxID=400777 RepID=A0A3B0CC93_9BACL|nr:transposase [Paenibacillus ginsengarvi]
MDGLEIRTHKRSYSIELKIRAVQDYLSGEYSQYELVDKYKIASRTQLQSWIAKYNSPSSFKPVGGGAKAMTKGRYTTWQERIDIVFHCLAHKRDYGKTAAQFKISYNPVYQWVKKY